MKKEQIIKESLEEQKEAYTLWSHPPGRSTLIIELQRRMDKKGLFLTLKEVREIFDRNN